MVKLEKNTIAGIAVACLLLVGISVGGHKYLKSDNLVDENQTISIPETIQIFPDSEDDEIEDKLSGGSRKRKKYKKQNKRKNKKQRKTKKR
jgi:methionine-rich copper-binding protein CopC